MRGEEKTGLLPVLGSTDEGVEAVEELGRPARPNVDQWDVGSVVRGRWDTFFTTGEAELYEAKVEPVNAAFEAIADALRDLKAVTLEIWKGDVPCHVRELLTSWRSSCESLLLVHSHVHWHASAMARSLVGISGVNMSTITKESKVIVYTSYSTAKVEAGAARTGLRILQNLLAAAEDVLGSLRPLEHTIGSAVVQPDRSFVFGLRHVFRKKSISGPTPEQVERIRQLTRAIGTAFGKITVNVKWQVEFWGVLARAMLLTREVDMDIIILPAHKSTWCTLEARSCTVAMEGKSLFNSGALGPGAADFAVKLESPSQIEW